jgi:hypothetical protein
LGKIAQQPNVSNLEKWETLRDYSSILFSGIIDLVSGNLSFKDNFKCKAITVVFSSANTNTTVKHSLGFVPSGYIVTKRSGSFNIFSGTTAWDTNNIYLQTSAVPATIDVIVF